MFSFMYTCEEQMCLYGVILAKSCSVDNRFIKFNSNIPIFLIQEIKSKGFNSLKTYNKENNRGC